MPPVKSKPCICEYSENTSCVDKDGFQLEGYYVVQLNDMCAKHHDIYVYLASKKYYTKVSIEILRELEYKQARQEPFEQRRKNRFELIFGD